MHDMIAILVSFCFWSSASVAAREFYQLSLYESSSNFSQALYPYLASNRSNLVYSPISVQAALSLMMNAAVWDAKKEIVKLVFPEPQADTESEFKQVLLQWKNLTEVHVYSANGLFVTGNFSVETQFVVDIMSNYLAKFSSFYLHDPKGPEQSINDYVENRTNHYVKHIVPPNFITIETSVIFVNTVFFDGTWQESFNTEATRKSDFFTPNRGTIQVDMMQGSRKIKIRRDVLGADIIELPFHGNFAFYVALPQEINGITQLETSLNEAKDRYLLSANFKEEHLQLSLPKFRIETDLKLKDPLNQMGIRGVFSHKLYGLNRKGLFSLNEIFHKAVIEIQEAGSAPSATTPAKVTAKPGTQFQDFKVNHPFIFFLKDKHTNIIVYQGKFSG